MFAARSSAGQQVHPLWTKQARKREKQTGQERSSPARRQRQGRQEEGRQKFGVEQKMLSLRVFLVIAAVRRPGCHHLQRASGRPAALRPRLLPGLRLSDAKVGCGSGPFDLHSGVLAVPGSREAGTVFLIVPFRERRVTVKDTGKQKEAGMRRKRGGNEKEGQGQALPLQGVSSTTRRGAKW